MTDLTLGDRITARAIQVIGSWPFIMAQTVIVIIWGILNIIAWIAHWDPYPFILLNLFLSIQAAYAAPVIMMGQNRQAAIDRLEAHNDFLINVQAAEEIHAIIDAMKDQQEKINEIHQMIVGLKDRT